MDSGCFSTRGLRKGTTAKPLDGGVLPQRGARAPARGPAAAPPLLSLAPWLPPFSWREKTERENEPRVCGRRGVAEFCSREKSARPSDLDRRRRTAGNGGRRTGQMWSKREISAGRFGGPGPRCGLGAGAPRASWQAGCCWAAVARFRRPKRNMSLI